MAFWLIVLNGLTHFGIMPSAQASANSHFYAGRAIGIGYYLMAGLILLFWLIPSLREKKTYNIWLLVLMIISLIFWGYQLRSLYCFHCANGG